MKRFGFFVLLILPAVFVHASPLDGSALDKLVQVRAAGPKDFAALAPEIEQQWIDFKRLRGITHHPEKLPTREFGSLVSHVMVTDSGQVVGLMVSVWRDQCGQQVFDGIDVVNTGNTLHVAFRATAPGHEQQISQLLDGVMAWRGGMNMAAIAQPRDPFLRVLLQKGFKAFPPVLSDGSLVLTRSLEK